MTTILEKFRLNPVTPMDVVGLPKHQYTITSDQLIGIEVEVENVENVHVPRGSVWQAITDGSLRNNGMEFITAPIKASSAPAVLHQLMYDTLNQACHFSPRTSVHVHLNVQDMTPAQAIDMVLMYSVYEKLMYKFAGRGRIRNIYCVPITDTTLLTELVETGLNAKWSKYTGLNLVPIRGTGRDGGRPQGAYGTIEYRQMHGTASVEKLCIWIDLITSLKEYVLKTQSAEIRSTLAGMDDGFDFNALLNRVFGEKAAHLKYDGPQDVMHTYLAAKSALLSSKPRQRIRNAGSNDSLYVKFKG